MLYSIPSGLLLAARPTRGTALRAAPYIGLYERRLAMRGDQSAASLAFNCDGVCGGCTGCDVCDSRVLHCIRTSRSQAQKRIVDAPCDPTHLRDGCPYLLDPSPGLWHRAGFDSRTTRFVRLVLHRPFGFRAAHSRRFSPGGRYYQFRPYLGVLLLL